MGHGRDPAGLRGGQDLQETLQGGPLRLFRPRGCPRCDRRGYKGRLALHEILVNDDGLRLAIQKKAPISQIRELAMAGGMRTLLQDGIAKCLAGQTDLHQVLAVCSR